jgi:hypothetical protein
MSSSSLDAPGCSSSGEQISQAGGDCTDREAGAASCSPRGRGCFPPVPCRTRRDSGSRPAPGAWGGPKHSAMLAEEVVEIVGEEVRGFHGGEVPAAVEL